MSQKNDVQWVRPVSPETIPPGAGEFRSSPRVWVALSDGSVYMGSCLHRAAGAKYRELVHDWFLDHPVYGSSSLGCSYFNGATVEAWAELVFPEHPTKSALARVQGGVTK